MIDQSSHQIVVVEDDEDTCANLCDILELDGYHVRTASRANDALKLDDLQSVSIFVLDRNLPDGTAEDFLPRLKEAAPNAAVVIVTGYANLDSTIAALRLGAADYLLKPINPDALRASLRRITELKQAQQRALHSERLAVIGETMTALVHESRNALQRSQANLEMLTARLKDQPEALEYINRIQVAQDDLHRLYEEVRGYAAPVRINPQTCDVGEVLLEAWEYLAVRRTGKNVEFHVETGPMDLNCEIDRFAIRQVFRNILENALSACNEPVRIEIRFSTAKLGWREALRIEVRDNGPGIGSEHRHRVFDEFYTTKTHGTGLGMAISQRLVEAHSGQIEVDPRYREGASFVVTLPRELSRTPVTKT